MDGTLVGKILCGKLDRLIFGCGYPISKDTYIARLCFLSAEQQPLPLDIPSRKSSSSNRRHPFNSDNGCYNGGRGPHRSDNVQWRH